MRRAHEVTARFVLHVGDFGAFGTIVLTVRMGFNARSPVAFGVVDARLGAFGGFVAGDLRLKVDVVLASEREAAAWLSHPRDDRASVAEVLSDRALRRLPPALVA